MNPNAKEFVPAHILKRRQEEEREATRVGELTEKLDEVNLDNDHRKSTTENGGSSNSQIQGEKDSSTTTSNEQSKQQPKGSGDESARTIVKNNNPDQDKSSIGRDNNQHVELGDSGENNHHINSNDQQHNNNHRYINGEINDLEAGDDDRYLLKAGENFCEFNGEEFIIPGDDDEYQGEIQSGYDFGNEEDNADEDIADEYEKFLGGLPDLPDRD